MGECIYWCVLFITNFSGAAISAPAPQTMLPSLRRESEPPPPPLSVHAFSIPAAARPCTQTPPPTPPPRSPPSKEGAGGAGRPEGLPSNYTTCRGVWGVGVGAVLEPSSSTLQGSCQWVEFDEREEVEGLWNVLYGVFIWEMY